MKSNKNYFLFFLLGTLLPLLGVLSLQYKFIILVALSIINIVSNKNVKIVTLFPLFLTILSIDYIFDLYFFYQENIISFRNRRFLLTSIEYFSYLLLFNSCFFKKDGNSYFLTGIIFSLSLLSGLFLIDQFLNLNLFQVSRFWENQGREALFFTDPNAYGVFFSLIFPFCLYKLFEAKNLKYRFLYFISILISLLAASFSGSRTMVIGLTISSFCFFIFKFKIGKKYYIIPLLLLVIIISVISYKSSYFCSFFPKSTHRICNSLDLNQVSKSLYSRAVFTKLNLALIQDYPFTGVGFNKFEKKLPSYKSKLSLNIGNWSDNPNNFYLGIISELGLIGFLFFLIGISNISFKLSENNIGFAKKSAIISLLFMLITGPHINFIEVTILGSWLISTSIFAKREIFLINLLSLVLLILYIILKFPIYNENEFGLYAFEKNEFGNFQWTKKRFKKLIRCKAGTLNFSFRAVNPDLGIKPLELNYKIKANEKKIIFNNFEINRNNLSCDKDEIIFGEISRAFRPKNFYDVKDNRKLGIQLYSK